MPVLFPDTKGRYSIENTALDIFGPGNRFTAARLVGSTSTCSPTLRPPGLRGRAAYRVYLRPSHRSHRVYAKRHRIKVRYSGVGKYISNRMPPTCRRSPRPRSSPCRNDRTSGAIRMPTQNSVTGRHPDFPVTFCLSNVRFGYLGRSCGVCPLARCIQPRRFSYVPAPPGGNRRDPATGRRNRFSPGVRNRSGAAPSSVPPAPYRVPRPVRSGYAAPAGRVPDRTGASPRVRRRTSLSSP